MLPKFGPVELILILVIITMLFGVGKLPEIFGSVGRGVREFRKASEGGDDSATTSTDDEPQTPADPTAPAA
jgi:sec-independent protein translocase protein TatA